MLHENKITQVMLDDNSIDATKEIGLIFNVANTLRGPYKPERYKDVIIPMIILRRLECALKPTKKVVLDTLDKNPNAPEQLLFKKSGYPFYNKCAFDLETLLNDAPNIVENFIYYIDSFSPTIASIFEELKFKEQIKTLDKNNRLLGTIKKFSEIDLDPEHVDGIKMGYMFEEIIRRFSENAEAGDHYTPREVIRLLSSILLAEGCDDVFEEGREITVLDMACGTGGMLSTAHDFIVRMNADAHVRLFGQENNPESHAICLADMLIKNQDANNIRLADTMKEDCFENTSMRFVIANPPFGEAWGGKDAGDGVEKAVKAEHKKGFSGRFGAGLPGSGDMQLLFMQHAVAKLQEGIGRAAIITNGSPLFAGGTASGESQIRRYLLESDMVEAIIGLPSQLFYNTDIAIYAFILSKGKRQERKGKIQFIDATDLWTPLRKSLGKKRREISNEQIALITQTYANFTDEKVTLYNEKRKADCTIQSKIFDNEEFLYKEWTVYQPLQRRAVLNEEAIHHLETSDLFTANANIFHQVKFDELAAKDPRSNEDEKAYQKLLKGQQFTTAVLEILQAHTSEETFLEFDKFQKHLEKLIGSVEGMSDSRLKNIAYELSETDKEAVIQKNRKKQIIIDPTTKDTEIIKLNQDVDTYMQQEVLPHIPDALYFYEFNETKPVGNNNKIKLGAEFPFTRYFYEYQAPQSADNLLQQFQDLEQELTVDLQALFESEGD